ncbi:MerR family transcriptional regulator [Trichococcus ilyis]|uniref:DNA-binding transcriptional regulator, MerR family n=1 Tax=Trichococcus ilyis TaxID=640938 RepID=A0A143YHY4_9LACT|nr:MerR family transcriptional regulator [Trichococcus ilyis]CZQ91160.1 helix turn helix mercury resistance [Trichococcus ilyis]SEI73588.1 DNA-binding transcriptional regulator, MerR family [Trichococcus ilyis]
MDKEQDNLISISEFAELSSITRPNLIFYDREGILKPVVRNSNRYRLYDYKQLDQAYVITFMRSMGVSIKEIKSYFQNRSAESAYELLGSHVTLIEKQIYNLENLKHSMEIYLHNIQQFKHVVTPKFEIVHKAKEHINLSPVILSEEIDTVLDFLRACKKNDIDYHGHTGRIFTKNSMIHKKWDKADRIFFKSYSGKNEIKRGTYLEYLDYTDGSDIGQLYQNVYDYIQENRLEISGNTYEDYPISGISIRNSGNHLIRISVAIKETD